MDFKEFLEKQQQVYEQIRQKEKRVLEEGIAPASIVKEGREGYLVLLRHPKAIEEAVGEISREADRFVPAVIYSTAFDNVHTTLSDYGVSRDFSADARILTSLCSAVRRMKKTKPRINYKGLLYTPDGAIITGFPDENFLNLALELQGKAKEHGLELRLPWGAHITVSRFTEQRSPEKIGDLVEFFKGKEKVEIGESVPEHIDVGIFVLNNEGLQINVAERFEFN